MFLLHKKHSTPLMLPLLFEDSAFSCCWQLSHFMNVNPSSSSVSFTFFKKFSFTKRKTFLSLFSLKVLTFYKLIEIIWETIARSVNKRIAWLTIQHLITSFSFEAIITSSLIEGIILPVKVIVIWFLPENQIAFLNFPLEHRTTAVWWRKRILFALDVFVVLIFWINYFSVCLIAN